jgi:PAS domain S-box-containing protein
MLRELVGDLREIVFRTDAQGRWTFLNAAWTEITGFAVEAAMGHVFLDFVHPEDRAGDVERFQRLVEGREDYSRHEVRYLTADGGFRWVEVHARAIRDGAGRLAGASGTISNIHGRHEAVEASTRELAGVNRALRESERLHRTLVETSPDAIALTDPGGRVRMVNRASLELFGYASAREMVGRDIGECWRNEDPAVARKMDEELMDTGRVRDAELRLTRRDGSVFDAEMNGTVVCDAMGAPHYVIRMARDIGRRKAVERELQRSERWFRAVFDDAPIGIALIDAGARVQLANHRYGEMLERSAEELTGVPVRDFTHPDDWAASQQAAEALRFVSAPVQVLSKRYLTKSGRVVWARSTVANLLSLAEGEHLMIAMVEDVTARKQLEEQFRQAQKMEAVGRLAGGIAHDFNNVLTVVKGYGELLQKRVAADPSAARKASQIVKAAERAAQLVAQLLAFSRQQATEPKVMDVNAALREMGAMLGPLLREDIELTARLGPDTGSVRADPGQFGQMLMNLAVNARDAMPGGGRLGISTRPEEVRAAFPTQGAGPAEGASPAPGRYAVIEVTDTGCGMTAAVLSRIFEPFFTTKDVGKGTGLGLSTVYGIVQQAGGHIQVESAPGAGTTFHIYLPSAIEDRRAAAEGVAAARGSSGSETILLTEDEDAVREIVAETLRDRGYTVLEARHGREALELAEARQGPIDLLLTDIVMPRMGGPELWARIRERFPETRVLFLSGHTGAAPAPGPVLLRKPFSPEDLVVKVREILDVPAPVA